MTPEQQLALDIRQVIIELLGALERYMIKKTWLNMRSIVPRRERPPDWKNEYRD